MGAPLVKAQIFDGAAGAARHLPGANNNNKNANNNHKKPGAVITSGDLFAAFRRRRDLQRRAADNRRVMLSAWCVGGGAAVAPRSSRRQGWRSGSPASAPGSAGGCQASGCRSMFCAAYWVRAFRQTASTVAPWVRAIRSSAAATSAGSSTATIREAVAVLFGFILENLSGHEKAPCGWCGNTSPDG